MVTVVYTPAYQVYLSKRCAFSCDYCNFAHVPSQPLPSPKRFRAFLRTAQRAGAWQITLTSGEGIARLTEIVSTCRYYGFGSYYEYLYEICRLTLEAKGRQPLTPVLDVGAVPRAELRRLAPVLPLMRLMLDAVDPALSKTVHALAPQKQPLLRSLALQDTGRMGIPVVTGIRVGIGESPESWEEAAEIANSVHARHQNVMAFHLIPFAPEKFSPMADHPPVANEVYQQAIRAVRRRLDPSITLVAEIHRRPALAVESVVAGAFDLGPIRIADNEHFDLDILNTIESTRQLLRKINVDLKCETVLRPYFARDQKLMPLVAENMARFAEASGNEAEGDPLCPHRQNPSSRKRNNFETHDSP